MTDCPIFKTCFVHFIILHKVVRGMSTKNMREFCPPIPKWARGLCPCGVLSYTRQKHKTSNESSAMSGPYKEKGRQDET